jgi:hypothetical protein
MLERLKKRWNHRADPNDSWYVTKLFSKEWFGSILIILCFLVVVAGGYLIASWLLGDYKAGLLFDFLLGGMVVAIVAFAWGLDRK